MTLIDRARKFHSLFDICQNLPGVQSVRNKLMRAINSGKLNELVEALRFAKGYEKIARAYQKCSSTLEQE
jgi:hypothetical protein